MDARQKIEQCGYVLIEARTLESDQLFDQRDGGLRQGDKILRLRRTSSEEKGERSTLTYKGPASRERYKSREEIEFDVSDGAAFVKILDRLGYVPAFRYEKYRTTLGTMGEPGVITIDETPIGVFLELEGPAEWIDQTAARLGYSPEDYMTISYAGLYREHRLRHPTAAADMTFG